MKLLLPVFFILVFSSCVTQKKYNELLSDKVKLEGELAVTRDSLSGLQDDFLKLEEVMKMLREDTTLVGRELREKGKKLAELEKEYEKIETYYNNLLNNSGKLNRDLEEQKQQLLTLKESLEKTRLENEALEANLAEREKKVAELENILASKDEAVNGLKKRISDALLNFKENDLTIEVKNGKVYVSLAEQLLFGSGSIDVDPKGVTALRQLANAIKDQKDINIMVEGHTDNVPIGRVSKYMQDNWDLSVMRATSIVRILTKAGVSEG
ncbi:MAG: OmpA family protein, partial [Cyclobacteriaceae bacterium]|nr:OmpA family protein [Cyclobacteriaceae bacterium]